MSNGMCCAASVWMLLASSESSIVGSGIFFTITECPLTEVATALGLMAFSVKILVMALETLPESTIIESTTMSDARGSTPMCATSISPWALRSSTALMLLEPMSKPTITFAPPNKPIRSSSVSCDRSRGPRLLLAAAFADGALALHPTVQDGFLEFPAVPQFEGGNLFLVNVLVKCVGAHAKVLRSLANVHHFTRIGHKNLSPFHKITLSLAAGDNTLAGTARAILIAFSAGVLCRELYHGYYRLVQL